MSHDHSSPEHGGTEHVMRRSSFRWRLRFAWATTLVTGAMVATGSTVAISSIGWLSALALAAALTVVGVLVTTCVACLRPVPTAVFVQAAIWTAVGGVAVWGLAVLSPWVAAAAAAVGIVEFAVLLRADRSAAEEPGRAAEDRPSWEPPAAVVDAMAAELLHGFGIADDEEVEVGDSLTDAEVCHAWRISFVALERARQLGAVGAQARIAQFRSLLLDELERRQPRGFAAWLKSGPRAAGDPSRHLTS